MRTNIMTNPLFPPEQIERLFDSLDRIASALEASPSAQHQQTTDFSQAFAYRWQRSHGIHHAPHLIPVTAPQLIAFDQLCNIELQIERIYQNTLQFLHRYPANNALMTGARGTGKSSLVRACLHEFHQQGLRLIEVEKQHLDDLPLIIELVCQRPERFIVFCDDLSFEDGEHHYKALKTVLDGSVVGAAANVLIYATSNRRHLVTEKMVDNLDHRKDHQGEIHPSDSLEEKISLSDRFGLRLHFYSFSQDEYLTAVSQWVKSFGFAMNDSVRDEALHWATEHGSRSGRIALQFARDYAGRTLLKNEKLL
jgi:hypothetical protein